MEKEIKVTGERSFGTGAQRDPNDDKGRFDLLSPLALKRLAQHTQKGGNARGNRNWENGIPIPACLDSAVRHIYAYILNELMGQEQDEDHLAAAQWNLMVATHFDELITMGYGDPKLGNFLETLEDDYRMMAARRLEPNRDEIHLETIQDEIKKFGLRGYLTKKLIDLGYDPDTILKPKEETDAAFNEAWDARMAEEILEKAEEQQKEEVSCATCKFSVDGAPEIGSDKICSICSRCSLWMKRGN